ncbi:MAG TPA: M55 family metallopeptidase [Nocardioidaceae bacterium]|nr:M55 family metallopeptidase [Nocardioidaceae bacterium]
MRALISADMEGATGVTCPDDCIPGTSQYARFRPIFTADVNAVALGFLDAGLDEVVVTEAHDGMRNLLLEQLDPRISLVTGRHKTYAMLEGISPDTDVAAFVGYHSAAGTAGVLSHTFMGTQLVAVTLNGRLMSEGYLNAMLCAEYGVRLALVSGDDLTCADAADYAPTARGVVVKEAVDRYTARCLSPEVTAAMLRSAAAAAVESAAVPVLPEPPYTCELEFANTSCPGAVAQIPGVERPSPRVVRFGYPSVDEVYRCFAAATRLASLAIEREYG